MSNLVKMETRTDRYVADAKELLLSASDQGFESVFIIGLRSDGTICAKKSATQDTMKFLGALEFAKSVVMEKWK